MAHIIPPTIGRKVWFRPNGVNVIGNKLLQVFDDSQALDATVVCVADAQTVNLLVVDHAGVTHAAPNIRLVQPQAGDLTPPEGTCYCEWMPYQVGQARSQIPAAGSAS